MCLFQETRSYALLHVCHCIYGIQRFDTLLKAEEKEVLALATLRALELARLRTFPVNAHGICKEEHLALNLLENGLVSAYRKNNATMHETSFSSILHKVYMKMLCECNSKEGCFFELGLPLVLISFLFTYTLQQTYATENRHRARCLGLYTLCHSYKPLSIYTDLKSGKFCLHKYLRISCFTVRKFLYFLTTESHIGSK